jgi:hypothetical protein
LDTLQPIVIDFGISIIINDVKTEKQYKEAFYIYSTDYLPWSIDIVVMSYLVQKYSTFESLVTEIDIQEIQKIINIKTDEIAAILNVINGNVINGNVINGNAQPNSIAPLINDYQMTKYQKFTTYKNKKVRQVIEELKEHYKEWDVYSIAIMTASIAQNYRITLKPKLKEKIIQQLLV